MTIDLKWEIERVIEVGSELQSLIADGKKDFEKENDLQAIGKKLLSLACLKQSILETITDIAKSSRQSLKKVIEITLLPRLK